MNGSPALAISEPTAWTSWLPAGPTTATILEFEVNCWVWVVAWAGSSWVSPWTSVIFVLRAALSSLTASCAKCSCSCPSGATDPVSGPSMPIEATQALVVAPPLALLLPPPPLLPHAATARAPSAAAAIVTVPFIEGTSISIRKNSLRKSLLPQSYSRFCRYPTVSHRRPTPRALLPAGQHAGDQTSGPRPARHRRKLKNPQPAECALIQPLRPKVRQERSALKFERK